CLVELLLIAATTGTRPASADDKAEGILARCRAATAKLKSLKADLWLTQGSNALIGTVTLKKPNKAWIQVNGLGPDRIVSDGKALLIYIPSKHQCLKLDPGADGSQIPAVCGQIEAFFHPQNIGKVAVDVTVTYAGRQKFEGADYDVIDLVTRAPQNPTLRYFISPQDFLLHRLVIRGTGA